MNRLRESQSTGTDNAQSPILSIEFGCCQVITGSAAVLADLSSTEEDRLGIEITFNLILKSWV
jgi:hypothetical protein